MKIFSFYWTIVSMYDGKGKVSHIDRDGYRENGETVRTEETYGTKEAFRIILGGRERNSTHEHTHSCIIRKMQSTYSLRNNMRLVYGTETNRVTEKYF